MGDDRTPERRRVLLSALGVQRAQLAGGEWDHDTRLVPEARSRTTMKSGVREGRESDLPLPKEARGP
eukprot:2751292-Pyramimonas_sp.AAC.1